MEQPIQHYMPQINASINDVTAKNSQQLNATAYAKATFNATANGTVNATDNATANATDNATAICNI